MLSPPGRKTANIRNSVSQGPQFEVLCLLGRMGRDKKDHIEVMQAVGAKAI